MRNIDSLKNYRQFQFVYTNGRSFVNKYFVMYIKENGTDKNRIGISVSKKVGNSVVRHHITRLLRECIRKDDEQITNGKDIVIIARGMANGRSLEEIDGAVLHLCRLHGILKWNASYYF